MNSFGSNNKPELWGKGRFELWIRLLLPGRSEYNASCLLAVGPFGLKPAFRPPLGSSRRGILRKSNKKLMWGFNNSGLVACYLIDNNILILDVASSCNALAEIISLDNKGFALKVRVAVLDRYARGSTP